jgi:hypothetical protein
MQVNIEPPMPNRQEVYSKTTGSPAVTERPKTTLLGQSVNNCLGATAITLLGAQSDDSCPTLTRQPPSLFFFLPQMVPLQRTAPLPNRSQLITFLNPFNSDLSSCFRLNSRDLTWLSTNESQPFTTYFECSFWPCRCMIFFC